jgi:hypothetical protein
VEKGAEPGFHTRKIYSDANTIRPGVDRVGDHIDLGYEVDHERTRNGVTVMRIPVEVFEKRQRLKEAEAAKLMGAVSQPEKVEGAGVAINEFRPAVPQMDD